MTPEQRYLFDINGYLHIPDVLSEAELAAAREAIERYLTTPEEELPQGFSPSEDGKIEGHRCRQPFPQISSPNQHPRPRRRGPTAPILTGRHPPLWTEVTITLLILLCAEAGFLVASGVYLVAGEDAEGNRVRAKLAVIGRSPRY